MRKILLFIMIIFLFTINVSAAEFTAPTVPAAGEKYFPENTETFSDGLWYIIKTSLSQLNPSIRDAAGICLSTIALTILVSILDGFPGVPKQIIQLITALAIGLLLIKPSNAFIHQGVQTVEELSEYGKLFTPVMTAALAAQGATTTSAALYAGTVIFNTILTVGISALIIPLIYIYMALSIAGCAIGEEMIKNISDFIKWLITWCLKIAIYLFTGYMSITGVVSGTTDAAVLKATKLTISGFVPVVGNIISDASEAVLVSVGIMKSAAGIYGLLAIIAICIGPFLHIGTQYLFLKLSASICSVYSNKTSVNLLRNFAGIMGILLAMTGTVCLMLLISTICFMKGVA